MPALGAVSDCFVKKVPDNSDVDRLGELTENDMELMERWNRDN